MFVFIVTNFDRFKKQSKMSDFDPTKNTLNNAINDENWLIIDVRNAHELPRDGNLRDKGKF